MSTIDTKTNEQVWKLYQFLGLHENPDGDTKLKMGEASVCRNWKVTRDRNLKKRPGIEMLFNFSSTMKCVGLWFGTINEDEIGIAILVSSSALQRTYAVEFYRNGYSAGGYTTIGTLEGVDTEDRHVEMFAFNNKVYFLCKPKASATPTYYFYDGNHFHAVNGYDPVIAVSVGADGSGTTPLESLNMISNGRRFWITPTQNHASSGGYYYFPENVTYHDIEHDMQSFVIKNRLSGVRLVENADYYFSSGENPVTHETLARISFNEQSNKIYWDVVNSLEVTYECHESDYRDRLREFANFNHAEFYLGAQDSAVFVYGNDTNQVRYSGVTYDGQPSAEYFPALNVLNIADANTPVTALIRHNNALMCYKTSSAYRITFGLITLPNNTQEYGFYVVPVNKSIGNAAVGQVYLVNNAPVTLFEHDLYKWENASPYSAEITRDERMAIRISDRIYNTLKDFDLSNSYCYDDNYNQEFYVWYQNKAVVWNYAVDAWYTYTIPASVFAMINIHGDVICASEHAVYKFTDGAYVDENIDGTTVPIDCYWESGSIDFGKPYQRKYMSELWVGTKPEEHSYLKVTVMTDKKSEYVEREVSTEIEPTEISKPQITKLKIKAKKFAFLKLILKTQATDSSATVLMVDPKIRETGYVK